MIAAVIPLDVMENDASKRHALRENLRAYMRHEIRTFAFDDANSKCMHTDDVSLNHIANYLYLIHDDKLTIRLRFPRRRGIASPELLHFFVLICLATLIPNNQTGPLSLVNF